MEYDVIIGLEIHAELKTKSKMFCACDNDAHGKAPNTCVCPVCLGHPGTLPVPNKQAIEWTILTGLALHCHVNEVSKFDRKNYFYPDLPKAYQISQYDLPLVYGGYMLVNGKNVAITRIHLEEDTGKNIHPSGKPYSLIDMNRAGTPLMEMVTEPVLESAEQAKIFCQNYQQILRYLDISDANMEKGEMRCEANISLQEKGKWNYEGDCRITALGDYKLNPKVEVKNINSFRALEKAINYEIKRQSEALRTGEPLVQETRGWNEDKGETISQRKKETSADYRYFPEPDIPPLRFTDLDIKRIGAGLGEMPPEKKARFRSEYGFDEQSAETICADKQLAAFAENVISELEAWTKTNGHDWEQNRNRLIKLTSNWICSELLKFLGNGNNDLHALKHISAENFAELVTLIFDDKISSSAGQTILAHMVDKGGDPSQLMTELGLEQVHDDAALQALIAEVIAKNPAQVAEYKAGKESILQYLVGQCMAASRGKANPKMLVGLLKELLK